MKSITQKIPHVAYGTLLVRLISKFCEIKMCDKGEIIFSQGQPANTMLFILSGKTEVLLKDPTTGKTSVIASRVSGEMTGELALIENTVRSTTLIAKSDTTFIEITKESFEKIVKLQPDFATRVLGSLRSKFAKFDSEKISDLH